MEEKVEVHQEGEEVMTNKKVKKVSGRTIAIYVLVFLCGLFAGAGTTSKSESSPQVKEVVKNVEVVKYKTPASCKRAIEIDNKIFVTLGESLPTLDLDNINKTLDELTAERIKVATECINE